MDRREMNLLRQQICRSKSEHVLIEDRKGTLGLLENASFKKKAIVLPSYAKIDLCCTDTSQAITKELQRRIPNGQEGNARNVVSNKSAGIRAAKQLNFNSEASFATNCGISKIDKSNASDQKNDEKSSFAEAFLKSKNSVIERF